MKEGEWFKLCEWIVCVIGDKCVLFPPILSLFCFVTCRVTLVKGCRIVSQNYLGSWKELIQRNYHTNEKELRDMVLSTLKGYERTALEKCKYTPDNKTAIQLGALEGLEDLEIG